MDKGKKQTYQKPEIIHSESLEKITRGETSGIT